MKLQPNIGLQPSSFMSFSDIHRSSTHTVNDFFLETISSSLQMKSSYKLWLQSKRRADTQCKTKAGKQVSGTKQIQSAPYSSCSPLATEPFRFASAFSTAPQQIVEHCTEPSSCAPDTFGESWPLQPRGASPANRQWRFGNCILYNIYIYTRSTVPCVADFTGKQSIRLHELGSDF